MNRWLQTLIKTALSIVTISKISFALADSDEPFIFATDIQGDRVIVSAHVPAGYQSAVLEISKDVSRGWHPIVTGQMVGEEGVVTFNFPDIQSIGFMRVRAGYSTDNPNAPYNGHEYF